MNHIAVFGCTGAIGRALIKQLIEQYPQAIIDAYSRQVDSQPQSSVNYQQIDYDDESSIANAADSADIENGYDLVIVATGILHQADVMPEKSLRDLSANKFQRLFAANTIFPALVAKHFLPKMNKQQRSVFAALSARVGSISDNHLGGWYAYRASKAALNMVIKNASIEVSRFHPETIVVGLHPGTVDSPLSKPFQTNVAKEKLFTADDAAKKLLSVIDKLTAQDSGKCFAWDGEEIHP